MRARQNATAMAPSFDSCGWFARSASLMKTVGGALLPADTAVPQPSGELTVLIAEDGETESARDHRRATQSLS